MIKGITYILLGISILMLEACGGDAAATSDSSLQSQNGSTSGMVIQNNYLVALTDRRTVKTFDLSDARKPVEVDSITLNFVETLSAYGDKLVMLGTEEGSYILEVANEGTLTSLHFARHTRSCDPVIADNNLMYVTVRAGNRCGNSGEDRLLIYDISDEDNVWLLGSLPLPQPKGLAISDSTLYVCTSEGMQSVDVSNPTNPVELTLYSDLNCNDLIVHEQEAVISADAQITLASLNQLQTPSAQIKTGQ